MTEGVKMAEERMFSLFVTARFQLKDLHKAKAIIRNLSHGVDRPFYTVFEQEGAKGVIEKPHVHVVILSTQMEPYRSLILSMFRPITDDVVILQKSVFLTGDLLLRYLQGYKKNSNREVRAQTARWRSENHLLTMAERGVMRKIRQGLTKRDRATIEERTRLYE